MIFYAFVAFCVVLAVPVTMAVLLRRNGIWNGILCAASMLLAVALLASRLLVSVVDYGDMTGNALWMVFGVWTLVFGLFSLEGDRSRIPAIVALSVFVAVFILLVVTI